MISPRNGMLLWAILWNKHLALLSIILFIEKWRCPKIECRKWKFYFADISYKPVVAYLLSAEGGAALIPLPHALFGLLPIFNTNFPPFFKSSWLNQGFSHSWPFSVADWMYLFSSEAFGASISNTGTVAEGHLCIGEKRTPDIVDGQFPEYWIETQWGENYKWSLPPPSSSPGIPIRSLRNQVFSIWRIRFWVFQGWPA